MYITPLLKIRNSKVTVITVLRDRPGLQPNGSGSKDNASLNKVSIAKKIRMKIEIITDLADIHKSNTSTAIYAKTNAAGTNTGRLKSVSTSVYATHKMRIA